MNNYSVKFGDLQLPTESHKKVVSLVKENLEKRDEVMALVIYGSVARNKGSYNSDLDFAFFCKDGVDGEKIEEEMNELVKNEVHSKNPEDVGLFFGIDIHFHKGEVEAPDRHWTDGPDRYETEIGNIFVYSTLVFEKNGFFTNLREKFVPYYDENLRKERLKEVLNYCRNNIWHIEPYVKRGLYFQAFKRLIDATREFMQALFMSRKIYPIAYDKWVKEQFIEILQEPDLYKEFVKLYEVHNLESDELINKGNRLLVLVDQYIKDE